MSPSNLDFFFAADYCASSSCCYPGVFSIIPKLCRFNLNLVFDYAFVLCGGDGELTTNSLLNELLLFPFTASSSFFTCFFSF